MREGDKRKGREGEKREDFIGTINWLFMANRVPLKMLNVLLNDKIIVMILMLHIVLNNHFNSHDQVQTSTLPSSTRWIMRAPISPFSLSPFLYQILHIVSEPWIDILNGVEHPSHFSHDTSFLCQMTEAIGLWREEKMLVMMGKKSTHIHILFSPPDHPLIASSHIMLIMRKIQQDEPLDTTNSFEEDCHNVYV